MEIEIYNTVSNYQTPRPVYLKRLKPGQTEICIIKAEELWNQSGILFERNGIYQIEVDPPEQSWSDGMRFPQVCDARGFKHLLMAPFSFLKRYPEANWFCLIGSMNKQEESFFEIGLGTKYLARQNAQLLCFANDVRSFYGNNKGSIYLKVTRVS